jgi:hypothetical protein
MGSVASGASELGRALGDPAKAEQCLQPRPRQDGVTTELYLCPPIHGAAPVVLCLRYCKTKMLRSFSVLLGIYSIATFSLY